MNRLIAIAAMLACGAITPRFDIGSILLPTGQAAVSVIPWPQVSSHYRIEVANGTIDIQFDPGDMRLSRIQVITWVEDAAYAVADYHGRFPVDNLELVITPVAGRGVPMAPPTATMAR